MNIINLSENNSILNHYLKEIRSVEIQLIQCDSEETWKG